MGHGFRSPPASVGDRPHWKRLARRSRRPAQGWLPLCGRYHRRAGAGCRWRHSKVHFDPARHDGSPRGQRNQSVSRLHRGILRRRHYEQHAGRRHSELESRRGAALRVPRGRSSGKASLHAGPRRPAGQPEMDRGETAARRERRPACRRGIGQGRQTGRYFDFSLSHTERGRTDYRVRRHHARHHRPGTGARGQCPAGVDCGFLRRRHLRRRAGWRDPELEQGRREHVWLSRRGGIWEAHLHAGARSRHRRNLPTGGPDRPGGNRLAMGDGHGEVRRRPDRGLADDVPGSQCGRESGGIVHHRARHQPPAARSGGPPA